MLAINPLLLRWDVGFQLSFLATVGIVAFSPLAEKYVLKKYRALGILEIILLTIAAQIFALPIIAYNFHALSLVSLLANLLILPFIPLTMLLVFLVGIFGFISSTLSLVFSWLAFLFLKYITFSVSLLAGLKWASLEIGGFRWEYLLGWYFALGALLMYIEKRQRLKLSKRIAASEQEEIF
jgi:competence protein ComEC